MARHRSLSLRLWVGALAVLGALLFPREVHAAQANDDTPERPAAQVRAGAQRPEASPRLPEDPRDPRREELRKLFRQIEVEALSQGGPLGVLPPGSGAGASVGVTPGGPGAQVGSVGSIGGTSRINLDAILPGARDSIFKVILPPAITGTGFGEAFLVRLAPTKANSPRPLLVVFHKFGSTHNEIPINTVFFEQAIKRNWNLVAPMGGSTKHFGAIESQINTELALEWLLENHGEAVDRERVYGVGFSMGGGAALSFAARHQDPDWLPFAAVVNHTGGTDLKHTWLSDFGSQWILEFWFGGTPSQTPFEYERISMLDFNSNTLAIQPGTDMARNLRHMPVRNFYVTQDPLAYLVTSTQVFHNHLNAIGGNSELIAGLGAVHEWQSLNQPGACTWLGQHRYQRPSTGTALADRDGNWFDFHVTQDAGGAFSPFEFDVDAVARRIALEQSENVFELRFDLAEHGVDPLGGAFEVRTQAADGLGDELVVLGLSNSPASVTEGGLSSSNWTWDPALSRLVLLGPGDSQGTTFVVVP